MNHQEDLKVNNKMPEKEREINKGTINFKISKENKEKILDKVESFSDGFISNLFIKGSNAIVDLKMRIDKIYGNNKEKIHDYIVDFLIGG